jgi:hypothetical protein
MLPAPVAALRALVLNVAHQRRIPRGYSLSAREQCTVAVVGAVVATSSLREASSANGSAPCPHRAVHTPTSVIPGQRELACAALPTPPALLPRVPGRLRR